MWQKHNSSDKNGIIKLTPEGKVFVSKAAKMTVGSRSNALTNPIKGRCTQRIDSEYFDG